MVMNPMVESVKKKETFATTTCTSCLPIICRVFLVRMKYMKFFHHPSFGGTFIGAMLVQQGKTTYTLGHFEFSVVFHLGDRSFAYSYPH